jgi:hypothetical protein
MSVILEPSWNKPVKEYDRALDPLGMNRVNDRMVAELVQGFTSLTPRARYYSFYVWAIDQIRKKNLAKNFVEFKNTFYDFERLFMLSCIAHEEKAESDNHNDVNGSATGRNVWNDHSDKIPLNFSYFGNRLGGYGQYYQGSLVNLMLVEQQEEDEFERPSKLGSQIIKNFDTIAKDSKFLSHVSKSDIPKDELIKIGEKICLCKIKNQKNSEKKVLTDLLFGLIGQKDRFSQNRFQSLSLILQIINQVQNKKVIEGQDFLDAVYFGQIKTSDKIEFISIPNKLDEVSKKWKLVKAHDNYSLASESILQMFLEFLQQDIVNGQNIDDFNQKAIESQEKFNQILKIRGKITDESVQDIIQMILEQNNINKNSELLGQSKRYDSINISSEINEHYFIENLENIKKLKNFDISNIVINSIFLVLLTGLRFFAIINSSENSIKWLKRLEKNDTGVLQFTNFVADQIKQNVSFGIFVRNFISKFVISQAESIYKEKIRSSTNPKCWFHKEGTQYFKDRDYRAKHRAIRFSTAISLMHDLDLLDQTEGSIRCTKQSQQILDKIL